MAKQLIKRSEVRVEDTWKTEDIYADVSLWEKDLKKAEELSDEMAKYVGKLTNAQNVYEVCKINEEIEYILTRTYNYAERCSDVDTTNAKGQELVMKIRQIFVSISEKTAFMVPELLLVSKEDINGFYEQCEELKRYKNFIDNIFRCKEHALSPEMEKLLASGSEVVSAPRNIYSMFNNADITFPEVTDEDGEKIQLTHGRFIPLLESGNRAVREEAFKALYSTYGKYKNMLAAVYQGHVKGHVFNAKARKYGSSLEAAVDSNNVPKEVYLNLIEAVHQNMNYMHKYVELRKKILNVPELHMYDVYVPLVKEADATYSFEKAKEIVYEALKPLGEDYRKVIKEGFENRWIDVYENEGKRSGAYSAGVPGCHPFVLLNHSGTLDSMFTLAHEMGHAMHSYLSYQNQPFIDSEYVIFVAEVASTCNEVLLMKYLLKNTTDKAQRAYLINHFLDSFKGTVYRQTMFAEFELKTHEMAEKGEPLTPDALAELYYNLNKTYFGEGMVVDKEIAMEWERIPHFYYNFYVYQYATGFSAAVALATKILEEGEPAVKNYLKFLSGGCSKSPIELLRTAGVDMATPEPVNAGLKLFGELIDEMDELMKSADND